MRQGPWFDNQILQYSVKQIIKHLVGSKNLIVLIEKKFRDVKEKRRTWINESGIWLDVFTRDGNNGTHREQD